MDIQTEKMRQHWASKKGVSLSREFTDAERQAQLEINKRNRELREKYSLDMDRDIPRKYWYGEVFFITDFEPVEKIYPEPIKPIPQKFDGVETVGTCFGKPERLYLLKKNISMFLD